MNKYRILRNTLDVINREIVAFSVPEHFLGSPVVIFRPSQNSGSSSVLRPFYCVDMKYTVQELLIY